MLELAAVIGASGVIALPIRRPVHLLDLSPIATEEALITQMAVATLRLALNRVGEGTVPILLEPLNRYESYYLKTLADAVALCEQVGDPRVQVMADLFHMSIEEVGLAESLIEAGSHVGHVHLADSNRLLPGRGHTNFVTAFNALHAIGFSGWMALECGVPGEASKVLPETVSFLRETWERAIAL
jgi:sugar phosphate isomerase/epimerase